MSSQVYIIASEDIRNEAPDESSVSKLDEISKSYLVKILERPTTLYFGVERECIDFASLIFEKSVEINLSAQFIGFGVLFNRKVLFGDDKKEDVPDMPDHQFIHEHNPSPRCLSSTNNKDEIIETILAQYEGIDENLLLITKMDLFNALRSELIPRQFNPLHFGMVDVSNLRHINQELGQPANENLLSQRFSGNFDLTEANICNQLEELLKSELITSKFSQHFAYSQNEISLMYNLETQLKAYESKLLSLLAHRTGSSVSYHDVIKIEGLVKALKSKLESLSSIIKQAKNMCNTFANPDIEIGDEDFLEITKFHFDQKLGKFKFQIENKTQFDYYNVTAYLLDDKENGFSTIELCKIRIIEKGQKIWKELDDDYTEKFYGLHLTLVYRGKHALREPYFISPCRLKVEVVGEHERTVEVEGFDPEVVTYKKYKFFIKNYSNIKFGKVELSLPENIKPEQFGGKEEFNYGVTWVTSCEIDDILRDDKSEMAKQYRVFACDGNAIISNTIKMAGIQSGESGVTFA